MEFQRNILALNKHLCFKIDFQLNLFFYQVARFSARDSRYRQAVLLRDVPWAIPLQDINSALAKQGIIAGNVERSRHLVRVEVKIASYSLSY